MRKLTLEILTEDQQPESAWIWEAWRSGEMVNGMKVVSMATGHVSCPDMTEDGLCNITGQDPKNPE